MSFSDFTRIFLLFSCLILSRFLIKPSISLNSFINWEAVLGPIPGAPGILSTLSPVKACIKITLLGLTPNFSSTSFISIFLFFIGSSIVTLLLTSCIKSLSEETMIVSISSFSANFT